MKRDRQFDKINDSIKKKLDKLDRAMKRLNDSVGGNFNSDQKKGAKFTAESKRKQKEWFYNNIWKVAVEKGITLLENIIRDGIKGKKCERVDGYICFNNIKRTENTIKRWNTEFKKDKSLAS